MKETRVMVSVRLPKDTIGKLKTVMSIYHESMADVIIRLTDMAFEEEEDIDNE